VIEKVGQLVVNRINEDQHCLWKLAFFRSP